MVHTRSSRLSSGLLNGCVSSSEEETLRNGSYSDPIGQRKPKKPVSALLSSPPGSGSVSSRLRSRTKNMNVSDDKVELNQGENAGEQERLKSAYETRFSGVDVRVTRGSESHLVTALEDTNVCVLSSKATEVELNLGGNAGERERLKSAVERLCNRLDIRLTKGPEFHLVDTSVVGRNECRQSIIGTKQLRGRTVSIVGTSSPSTVSKFSNTVKVVSVSVEREKPVVEKSDHGDDMVQSPSPEVLVPLEVEKSKAACRRSTKNGVAIPSPVKLSEDMNGESIAKKPRLSDEGLPPPSHPLGSSGEKKSDNGDQSLAKSVSPEVLVEKSKAKVLKSKEAARRRSTRNVVATPSPIEESVSKKPRLSDDVLPPPSNPLGSSGEEEIARFKVKEALRIFHETCREIMREEEARPKERNGSKFRVDTEASKILKSKGLYLNTGVQITGAVPGVVVGDEFQYRMELNFLGIHRPIQAGIDYTKGDGKKLIATSIVAYEGYDDEVDDSDVLIYTGQGGYVTKGKKKGNEPVDQQLVKGNLALANSKLIKNPIRVVKGNSKTPLESSDDAKFYVYDGLYLVEDFWKETESHGKLVYKFRLRRIPGQPRLSSKVAKKSKTYKLREGLCNVDISEGKEKLPICAVNNVDDEKPPSFTYTDKMLYPDWCRPIPPKGCGCTKRCSESENCLCVAKNGGELPYNDVGAIIRAKPMVYECGPLCKCPPSCYLRVAQKGIKFHLEIFKTESRGWGVRSRNLIPSGSFICEYAGELLEDKEAERLVGKDEYLFDIGKERDKTNGFTIDAATKGNVGRFINHSCSPNLYVQDVMYDYEEKRLLHVTFFAMDDIPRLQELSYDYNYVVDQVRDAKGNIRKKYCYCGSSECTGRLY